MALKATIFKAELQVADMDRHHYADYQLTIARHPSETDERMMMRLLAFILHADEMLAFGRGLSAEDEPDVWRRSLTGDIELWIEVGLPDERALQKACSRARQVVLYAYGPTCGLWWKQTGPKLERLEKLTVLSLNPEQSQALARLAQRTMRLQASIQEGQALITDGTESVAIEATVLKAPQR